MSVNDPLDFPPELCSKPAALVGLCGLDVQNNPLHRTIWEVFSKSHERSPVNFKLFSLNHAFPPVKPKRTTYDWYIPKGLLKRNWMRKHLLEIPAVVALLFDWDDSNTDQLRLNCVAQLQALRASLGNHNTKIVVILIQKVAPLPDDAKASEKAKSLCAACDIDTKQLYVLPHGDHLQGYIVRLENALYDLAQNYYHQEIKLIKQHKDQLNKTTQQYLFVRHQFKLGFLSELKQDHHNAKKYYDLAYGYLKEVRISDTNIVEVKLIAGFITYKLCYLMFRLNQPRDAITNFKLHVEHYKNKTSSNLELLFEHYSWLSKQYSAFGDIFDDAVRQGLPPVQTQHPGFYYRLAAKYAIDRKMASLELCRDITSYPSSDPLMGMSSLEFYGQRPWRPGQLSAEPINPALELEGIAALKYKEKFVVHSVSYHALLLCSMSASFPQVFVRCSLEHADEHLNPLRPWICEIGSLPSQPLLHLILFPLGIVSLYGTEEKKNQSIIISLLGNAISQFKTYRCPRMRLELVVQMADEYFYSQDYGKALTLFSHILWDYKDEKWWLLLSTLLIRALSCAYMAASVQDYVIFSLEALGPMVKFNLDKRKKIFSNLMAVLQMKTPESEPGISAQCINQANNLWEASCRSGQPQTTKVDMNNLKSCIEAKARFVKQLFNVDEIITVEVFIRSSCPYPVELSHLSVVVKSSNYSSEFAVSSEKQNLIFEPGIVKKLLCEFKCDPSDIGKTIQIDSMLLTIGSLTERSAVLRYSLTTENNETTVEKPSDEFQFYRLTINDPVFDKIESLGVAKIVSAESKVKITIKHDAPALLSEWYPIEINILNEENSKILELVLEVKLQYSRDDTTVEQSTQLCVDVKNISLQSSLSTLTLPLKDVPQNGSQNVVVFLRGLRIGDRALVIKLNYSLERDIGPPTKSFVETLIKVPVLQPFDVSAEILSMKFEQIEKCFARYPFILSPTIRILSPWPIKIHQSSLEPGLVVKSCDKTITSHLAGTVLNEGECGTDMFTLLVEEPSEQPLALGTYLIKWSRVNSSEVTSSSVTMPTVVCEATVVGVEMSLPAHGWAGKPMKVEYSLCNHTNNLLQLDLFMEASDAFMFAGQKQVLLKLLPGSVRKLEYNLYPLFSGLVALPRLVFRSPTEELMEHLNQVMDRNLSSHVYVMPQEKLNIQSLTSGDSV